MEFSVFQPPRSSPRTFLFLAPPCWPSLGLPPHLFGEVWSWAAELPGATVKDWNVGRAGVGWGKWVAGGVGGGGGFSLGWSEFSHLTRVEATRPCQADDITLQECLPPLLAQEALCGGAPPHHTLPHLSLSLLHCLPILILRLTL